MPPFTVIKLDIHGQETWRYSGQVLQRGSNQVLLEAYFDRDDRVFHDMPLCKGDRFVETYYSDRWYNIYEIHAREDDHLRGWYCNIGYPAKIGQDSLSYVDLALDLLVFPDGKQIILDDDEFAELPLSSHDRAQALEAMAEIQETFKSKLG
jgi:protein associated with RNAse G/E